jgi:hypothetical protein
MEKSKIITVPLPIRACYERLPYLLQDLGWQIVKEYPRSHSFWWRKGENWILKRRHDLWISLFEYQANDTKISIIIKDARIAWGRGDLLTQDMADVAEQIQSMLTPIAA